MKKLKNILVLMKHIFLKKPLMSLFLLISPIFSGFLTVYVYAAQVDLINIITNSVGLLKIKELISMVLMPFMLFLTISIVKAIINLFNAKLINKLGAIAAWEFQSEIVDITNKVPYKILNEKEFNDKLERAKQVVGQDLLDIVTNIATLVNKGSEMLSIIILLVRYKLYIVSVIILIMLCINLYIKVSTEVNVKRLSRQLTYNGRIADYLNKVMNETNSIREIRLYECKDYFLKEWGSNIVHQNKARYGARKVEIKMGILVSFIHTITIFIILFMLINKVKTDINITVGLLSVLFINLVQCKDKIFEMLWPICSLYLCSVKIHDLNDVLMYKNMIEEPEKSNGEQGSPVPIILKEVSFKYSEDSDLILDKLSLNIKPGEKIAVVGKNGAGKSTLIKLLLGLYKPDNGEILWNRKGINSSDISVVYQNYIKYEFTLRENIGLGDISRMNCDEEIIKIINKCGLQDLYKKCGSLDQPLGYLMKDGFDISGGQWQRIAIARALFRNSDLLIFDEPTASIDPQSELKIYKMLMEICKDKTVILVSHRLGWAKNADRIIVIDNKVIVEDGTHKELMDKKSIYYEMYTLQASWYVDNL